MIKLDNEPLMHEGPMPLATLELFLGRSHRMMSPGFKPNKIQRAWSCGCLAWHLYNHADDTTWASCAEHAPLRAG